MTPQRPGDDRFDELLRSAMHEEAETVVPSGDGLSKIQQQVAGRRNRQRWLRPMLALGSAAAVLLVGVGVYAMTNDDNQATVNIGDPTDTPTSEPTTASPTPSDVPAPDGEFPAAAIFPFTSAAETQTWQASYADGGHQPWVADPRAVSEAWVQNYLQVPAIDTFISKESDGDTADVTLGRTMTAEAKRIVPVTVVHLVKYGDAWLVTGASDPQNLLSISSPLEGSEVSSPLQVTGPGFGVDEAADVQVRDAETPTKLGNNFASWGEGVETWQTSVDFDAPSNPVGVVMALETSQADGGPQRLAAVQVRFGETTTVASAPKYFYGVKNGRITKFSSRTGAAIEYLTAEEPGGGASSPQMVRRVSNDPGPEGIYYLRGGGTCVNSVAFVNTDGTGAQEAVATPDEGYVIQSFTTDGTQFTLYEVACFPDMQPQAKLTTRAPSGAPGPIRFTAVPPGIEGDITYAPNSTTMLDAFLKTGMQGYIAKYDLYNDSSSTPERNGCPGYDVNRGFPVGVTTMGGWLWFAIDAGDHIEVLRCAKGTVTPVVTIPSGRGPSDLAVSPDSQAVLVSDDAGRVWKWDGSGAPERLPDLSVPLDHITW